MKTRKKKLPIEDTPVIDQEVIYARLIGLFISNRSLDFNVILASELSPYPPLMFDPTGQSTLKGKGNPAFICRTIEYIHQWYMVVIHASFNYQEGKTEWVPKIWESSAHGGHHIASLLRKTDVDVMQCGQQPAWWLITPSPIPEAARCQLLLRTGQLRYLNASARKLPPKLQCQEMINIT